VLAQLGVCTKKKAAGDAAFLLTNNPKSENT